MSSLRARIVLGILVLGGLFSAWTVIGLMNRPDFGGQDGHISLRPSEMLTKSCGPELQIDLDDLVMDSPVPCNLAGWYLTLPEYGDQEITSGTTDVDGRYVMVNLGVHGYNVHGGPDCEYWGTPEGIQLMKDANFRPSDGHCGKGS